MRALKGRRALPSMVLLLAVVLPGTVQAANRQVNFDEVTAPCGFFDQPEKLSTRYEALGVVFSGPAPGQGGEILNQCANFGVSGHSSPNFLAFNTSADNAGGPETLQFSPPASSVVIKVGSQSSATATLTAFDGSAMVAESSRTLTTAVATLPVTAGHITSARIASPATTFVVDDLVWSSPPVASNDSYATPTGTPLRAGSPGVLANDSDADGDSLSADLVSTPGYGTVELHSAGDFTYTPRPDFAGQDSFTYRAVGAGAGSTPATVTVSVSPTGERAAALKKCKKKARKKDWTKMKLKKCKKKARLLPV
jgi:hypothetical protein